MFDWFSACPAAETPPQVLGLEAQAEAPHARGSHHGLTRIIRLAYAEHPSYVPLLHRAYKLWDELEKESGKVGGVGLAGDGRGAATSARPMPCS